MNMTSETEQKNFFEEKTVWLQMHTPTGQNAKIGKQVYAEVFSKGDKSPIDRPKQYGSIVIEPAVDVLFDDAEINVQDIRYNEKESLLFVRVNFSRKDEQLVNAMFSVPIDMNLVVAIIRDWTSRVNRVKTILEAIKKE